MTFEKRQGFVMAGTRYSPLSDHPCKMMIQIGQLKRFSPVPVNQYKVNYVSQSYSN
jgi:hypothetical protein